MHEMQPLNSISEILLLLLIVDALAQEKRIHNRQQQ